MFGLANYLKDILAVAKNEERCLAIEVNPDKIASVVFDYTKQLVVRAHCHNFKAASSQAVLTELDEYLASLVPAARVNFAQVNLVLHPKFYSVHSIEAPKVPEEEYRQAVRWQLKDLVDIPLEDLAVDVFTGDPKFSSVNHRIYGVAADRKFLNNLAEICNNHTIQIAAIDIREFAIRNLLAKLQLTKEDCSVLILGESSSFMIISDNYLQLIRSFLVHGSNLTSSGAINDLTSEIERSYNYYQREFNYRPKHLIMVSGAPFPLDSATVLTESLKVTVTPLALEKRHFDDLMLDASLETNQVLDSLFALGGVYRLVG